jgi:hypothetical protein
MTYLPRIVTSRREAMERARQSRRPSRLGTRAGTAAGPDQAAGPGAGFPGLLADVWREARTAPGIAAAVNVLLTLGGRVPPDIQLRALAPAEECAVKVLFGLSWRTGGQHLAPASRPGPGQRPAFPGSLGLTTGGRLTVGVPSAGPLATREDLVDGVIRVPWSHQALASYTGELTRSRDTLADEAAGCRAWLESLGPAGRDELLEQLVEAAVRTAPFVLYQGHRRYTNFRERNNLAGKTLGRGHPDCALSTLRSLPLRLWSDSDAVLAVCLDLLIRSGGFARIEEANGTQLSLGHVGSLLERARRAYNAVAGDPPVAPAGSAQVQDLACLAAALAEQRPLVARKAQLYREIYGPLMHKIERVSGPEAQAAQHAQALVSAALRQHLPVTGTTLDGIGDDIAAAPGWLARPCGDFGTGIEAVVHESVRAAVTAFDADFAMSRGMRSLPRLVAALRGQQWPQITQWELPDFFCCVVAAPGARQYFTAYPGQLADIAWSMSARMQYNSWHFIAGNLPAVPEVAARDYFVPPSIPDIAYYSDQHHHGHVTARVRFSVRSPGAVEILGRTFRGFVDLRLLRCDGAPFREQDLLAAGRVSAFIARVTSLAGTLAAAGENLEITSFDERWHAEQAGGSHADLPGPGHFPTAGHTLAPSLRAAGPAN